MKLFHSIRWRVQLWHGVILLLVLAAFGFTAHRLQRANDLRRIDGELQMRLRSILDAMRRPPSGRSYSVLNINGPRDGKPEFHLDERRAALFSAETNSFYYVIWWRDGTILSRSDTTPSEVAIPLSRSGSERIPMARQQGDLREFYDFTPPGECFLVGRSIRPELDNLRELGWWFTALGSSVLVFGLLGGWVLASRAIRPIVQISSSADRIAQGDLSHRIRAEDTDSEFGALVTVLNSTFSRLETSFQQQVQFTSDASHELRTPLTVILTQTELALSRDRSPAEYRVSLGSCRRAAQRMRRLIDSLLQLARVDAGSEPLVQNPQDLLKIVKESVELLQPLADEHGVRVNCILVEACCLGDDIQLGQVALNLLSNAIIHNRRGGEVDVSTAVEQGTVVFKITDNGPGIRPEHIPRLFERFFRADASRNSSTGGSGLGLSIAKAIIDAHGGQILVSSTLGSGTTFEVRLPVG